MTPDGTSLLRVEGVSRRFGGYVALDGVAFSVAPSAIHALIGPNGAGKTTLFNIVSGILQPNAGRLVFEGRDYTGLRPDRVIAMGIARNFQQVRLFPGLSIIENVMVGRHSRMPRLGLREFFLAPLGFKGDDEAAAQRARETLDFVGFHRDLAGEASALTLVDQRRIEIARALVSEPRLLLLDEPAAGMNPSEVVELGGLIRRIRDTGRAVLLVEHHMRLVMDIADRITVLNAGRVIADGTRDEVRADAGVVAAYLGQAA